MPITLLRPGETGVVKRIGGAADTRRFLANLGFVDGSQVRVVSELCGNMIIHIKDSRVAVNKEMEKHIMVYKQEPQGLKSLRLNQRAHGLAVGN